MSLRGAAILLGPSHGTLQREFCIDNLLVRIRYIIVMIKWTGLAPWEFDFFFAGSLTSTFLVGTLQFPISHSGASESTTHTLL